MCDKRESDAHTANMNRGFIRILKNEGAEGRTTFAPETLRRGGLTEGDVL